jgi:hypothetical protein
MASSGLSWFFAQIRPNLLYDLTKWLIFAAISMALAGAVYLYRFLAGQPRDLGLIIVIFLVSFLLMAIAFILARYGKRKEMLVTSDTLVSKGETPVVDAETNRLRQIAIQQERQIAAWVCIRKSSVDYGGLTHGNPYVDFTISLLNESVFPITIDQTTDGNIYLDGDPLSGSVKILGSGLENFQPADERSLSIRQWVNASEVAMIRNGGAAQLRLSVLRVIVRGGPNHSQVDPQRLNLPDLPIDVSVQDQKNANQLTEIVKRDQNEIGFMVIAMQCRLEGWKLVNVASPWIQFRIEYFNGSLHPVTLGPDATGFITYGNLRFEGEITLPREWLTNDCPRGYTGTIQVKQWLNKKEAVYLYGETQSSDPPTSFFNLTELNIPVRAAGADTDHVKVGRLRLNFQGVDKNQRTR